MWSKRRCAAPQNGSAAGPALSGPGCHLGNVLFFSCFCCWTTLWLVPSPWCPWCINYNCHGAGVAVPCVLRAVSHVAEPWGSPVVRSGCQHKVASLYHLTASHFSTRINVVEQFLPCFANFSARLRVPTRGFCSMLDLHLLEMGLPAWGHCGGKGANLNLKIL